ncbi:hypothetical protein AOQ84DRAFT_18691 [Glonium stellatum]|uniref:Spindle pole body component n=1 Tax=Glonium stellatum TaxID=574774 RepID=A0A8E2JYY6_9PEZI|nr:hypothetical protein AOQ84DRAFT_18691 [Glonium stellatum]
MLHEILLSLSGHPSALFDAPRKSEGLKPDGFPLLSPPEAELLSSIGRLSQLHRLTREAASRISSSHQSTICRAVGTAITSSHLARFQQKVLDVESRILKKDASTVGAYNIVPLSGVVGEFDEWTRLMEWLWGLVSFIMPPSSGKDGLQHGVEHGDLSSGAAIIDKLRHEAQTGYPDIEEAAVDLGKVAETAWMRQLSTWVLYGRLPTFGATDFFIQRTVDEVTETQFLVNNKLLPKFVSQQTALSILFIGKSLNQIRALENTSNAAIAVLSRASELELLPIHLQHLSAVTTPISSAGLTEAIAAIRLSLSRNMLQHLLPLPNIIEILTLLQEFFLLGRGEFAVTLVTEADERIRSRHRVPGQALRSKSGSNLQGVLLKEGEITAVLARTWSVLSSLSGEEEHSDDCLDLAMDLIHLTLHKSSSSRPATPGRAKGTIELLPKISNVVFNDLLLSVPTSLTMDIRSPLDLFITNTDIDTYSSINAYLLAVRRAHLRLADLWRQSSIRREHPAPPAPQYSSTSSGKAILRARRLRSNARSREMRKVWATCGAAMFFLSENGAYFEGEVVQESWKHFREWIIYPEQRPSSSGRPQSAASTVMPHRITELSPPDSPSVGFRRSVTGSERAPHDPESLASAHRLFLDSLTYSLLLTDFSFSRSLRELLTHVDELVAFITRLQIIQQNLDLEEDGVIDDLANYAQEEKRVELELDRARKRVDGDLKTLVARLREIDAERVGSASYPGQTTLRSDGYEPWRVGGVDRLLMKLDWGSSADDEDEDGDWDNL